MSKPVVKAMKIGAVAKQNGWHGDIESEVIAGERITVLTATRNDERMVVHYTGNTMDGAVYSIFEHEWRLHCATLVLEKLRDWPDLVLLFKLFPTMNRPDLYGHIAGYLFSWDEPNDAIMNKLIGCDSVWYSAEAGKLRKDVVLPQKRVTKAQAKHYRIQDVGHRRCSDFIGIHAGFRSVLLDTLVRVH